MSSWESTERARAARRVGHQRRSLQESPPIARTPPGPRTGSRAGSGVHADLVGRPRRLGELRRRARRTARPPRIHPSVAIRPSPARDQRQRGGPLPLVAPSGRAGSRSRSAGPRERSSASRGARRSGRAAPRPWPGGGTAPARNRRRARSGWRARPRPRRRARRSLLEPGAHARCSRARRPGRQVLVEHLVAQVVGERRSGRRSSRRARLAAAGATRSSPARASALAARSSASVLAAAPQAAATSAAEKSAPATLARTRAAAGPRARWRRRWRMSSRTVRTLGGEPSALGSRRHAALRRRRRPASTQESTAFSRKSGLPRGAPTGARGTPAGSVRAGQAPGQVRRSRRRPSEWAHRDLVDAARAGASSAAARVHRVPARRGVGERLRCRRSSSARRLTAARQRARAARRRRVAPVQVLQHHASGCAARGGGQRLDRLAQHPVGSAPTIRPCEPAELLGVRRARASARARSGRARPERTPASRPSGSPQAAGARRAPACRPPPGPCCSTHCAAGDQRAPARRQPGEESLDQGASCRARPRR